MRTILLTAALLVGCNKVTYVNPTVPGGGKVYDTTGHFFLVGLLGDKNIAAYQTCPGGVARVQSKNTFGDLVLTFLTVGLYSPRTYEIECGGRS